MTTKETGLIEDLPQLCQMQIDDDVVYRDSVTRFLSLIYRCTYLSDIAKSPFHGVWYTSPCCPSTVYDTPPRHHSRMYHTPHLVEYCISTNIWKTRSSGPRMGPGEAICCKISTIKKYCATFPLMLHEFSDKLKYEEGLFTFKSCSDHQFAFSLWKRT